MMLNLTQDFTMLLEFVSQILIDGGFLPLWWRLQLRTFLCKVFVGQNSFQEVSHQVDTHTWSERDSIIGSNTLSLQGERADLRSCVGNRWT